MALHLNDHFMITEFSWFQLLVRPFAFAFLAVTYLFATEEYSKKSRIIWDITLSILLVALMAGVLLVFVAPHVSLSSYRFLVICIRIFNIICLTYITLRTLQSHLVTQKHASKTILSPFGFVFLGISQYSFLIWAIDNSKFAFYTGFVLRTIGLLLFLWIAYRTFYGSKKSDPK